MAQQVLTLFCRLILDIPKSINIEEEDAMMLNFGDINNTILNCKIQFVNLFKHEVIGNDVCYIATCEPATWGNCFTSSVLIVV